MRGAKLLRHWKTKAVAQKAISLLPGSTRINYVFQYYGTGTAARTEDWYRTNVHQARRHLANWQAAANQSGPPQHVLELGTGWHLTVPLCLALWGVDTVTTVDRTSLLRPDRLAAGLRLTCRLLAEDPGAVDAPTPRLDPLRNSVLRELAARPRVEPTELRRVGVHIHVGDARHLGAEHGPVDLFTSNNVLEHVSAGDLPAIFAAYGAIAADRAVMSHFIDLADHFSSFDPTISSRNFLRYSSQRWRFWDNDLVPQNRLQLSDYRRAHEEAGFAIICEEVRRAPVSELARVPVAAEFSRYRDEDLLVETAWLISRMADSNRNQ